MDFQYHEDKEKTEDSEKFLIGQAKSFIKGENKGRTPSKGRIFSIPISVIRRKQNKKQNIHGFSQSYLYYTGRPMKKEEIPA